MKVINKEEGWISHRLNIPGVRVWHDGKCQLVAKADGGWMTLGSARKLPVAIPANADELLKAAHDPLLFTLAACRTGLVSERGEDDGADGLSSVT